jgi:hypothetical protein
MTVRWRGAPLLVSVAVLAALIGSRATYLVLQPPDLDETVIVVEDADVALGAVQVCVSEESDASLLGLRMRLMCKMYDAVAGAPHAELDSAKFSSNVSALAAVQAEMKQRGLK